MDRLTKQRRMEEYVFEWKGMGCDLGGGPYKNSLIYESIWAKMCPFLPSDMVKDVEGMEPVFLHPADQQARFNDSGCTS